MGFEPTAPEVQLISSQPRYDHFDTAPKNLSQHLALEKGENRWGEQAKNIKLKQPNFPENTPFCIQNAAIKRPGFRVCPEFPNLAEFDGRWGKLWEPQKARVSAGFEKTEKKKERKFLGREVPAGRGKF